MTDYEEPRLTRREALKGGSAAAVVAGSYYLQQQLVGAARAQTQEPRIKLGSDYAIDDNPDGNGDFVIEHTPSGAEFRYDSGSDAWVPNVSVGSAASRQSAFFDDVNSNSLVIGGVQSDLHWTAESNSPYTSTTAASITPSGLDEYDMVAVFVKATLDSGADTTNISMQINGQTNAIYRYAKTGGVTATGQSELTPVGRLGQQGETLTFGFRMVNTGFTSSNDIGYFLSEGIYLPDDVVITGTVGDTSHSYVDQFTLDAGESVDWTVEIFGRDLP